MRMLVATRPIHCDHDDRTRCLIRRDPVREVEAAAAPVRERAMRMAMDHARGSAVVDPAELAEAQA